jgi:hypothetical protein
MSDTQGMTSSEDIFSLGSKFIKSVSKLKIDGVLVNCEFGIDRRKRISGRGDVRFGVLFFCDEGNTSMSIYEFWSLEKNKQRLAHALVAIKNKDLTAFKAIEDVL